MTSQPPFPPPYGQPPSGLPPYQPTAAPPKRPNHVLHLILTLLTCGFWSSVWITLAARYWNVDDYRDPAEHPGMKRRTIGAVTVLAALSVLLLFASAAVVSAGQTPTVDIATAAASPAPSTEDASNSAEGVSPACINAVVGVENGTVDANSVIPTCLKAGDSMDAIEAYVDSVAGTPAPATTPAKPKTTVAQREAIESAQSYVEMSGFSRAGLIKQLTSSYGEGFKLADATYAVDHIKVSWYAEAVESARSYLEMGGFSRSGLIQQLHSKYGEQFTLKQATYAANKVGL